MKCVLIPFLIFLSSTLVYSDQIDWQTQVRLTFAEEKRFFYPWFLQVDSENNLHIVYNLGAYELNDDDNPKVQGIYQKFSREGEALTEPALLINLADVPDTLNEMNRGLGLVKTNDELFYILLGCQGTSFEDGVQTNYYYYIALNSEGEVETPGVLLNELPYTQLFVSTHPPGIGVDSDGNVIFSGYAPRVVIGEDTTLSRYFYQRYSPEGDLIGGTHFADEPDYSFDHMQFRLSENDTMHFIWRDMIDLVNEVYYSKITPDDSLFISCQQLQPAIERTSVSPKDLELDSNGRPVFLLGERDDLHVRKYDYNMEQLFRTGIGPRNGYDIFLDGHNNIHSVATFDYWEDRSYLGYSCIDEDGELLDSALAVFGSDGVRSRFRDPRVFACDDGFVGVIFVDRRDYEELYLSYDPERSVGQSGDRPFNPRATILYPAYPNPFNSKTTISFSLPVRSQVSVNLFDASGRSIRSIYHGIENPGYHTLPISAMDLPSGSYFARIEAGDRVDMIKMSLVR